MKPHNCHREAVRYRGFLLLRQPNKSWLIRPERSPMQLLPFRTSVCSLTEAKKILDLKLSQLEVINKKIKERGLISSLFKTYK